jgi:hypothetical protein
MSCQQDVELQEEKLFSFLMWGEVTFLPNPHVICEPSWVGEGHGSEEVTRIMYLLLSVQYCVPHRCFGHGQGDRNKIRTIFLQVLYFFAARNSCGRMP